MTALKFDSIYHSYHNTPVLRNINFSVEESQITVILGKSGSGKSTLLQMINGFTKAWCSLYRKYDLIVSLLGR